MNRTAVFVTLLLTAACSRYVPPDPPAPRVVTPVSAPFERTWNAVIDVFAQEVITVETMEKASGFIVASRAAIPHYTAADSAAARAMADCGGLEPSLLGFRVRYLPSSAKYNVVVRSAGASSTVHVSARFIRTVVQTATECSSRGAFESTLESLVKARAEAQ